VRFKLTSIAGALLFVLAIVISNPTRVAAQEGEVTVVDEVVAQVNDDVITLSCFNASTLSFDSDVDQ